MAILQFASSHRCQRLLLLVVGCLCASVSIASAAQYHVNTVSDLPDLDTTDGLCLTARGSCSLRAAVMQSWASGGGSDEIEVPAGIYLLTGWQEDEGKTGDLDFTSRLGHAKSIRIRGAGPPAWLCGGVCAPDVPSAFTIIVAPTRGAGDRAFDIGAGATVYIQDLGIVGGDLRAPWPTVPNCRERDGLLGQREWDCDSGGAIRSRGQLYLRNVAIANNAARIGGAIHSMNSLTLYRVAVTGNHAYSRLTHPGDWQPWFCGGGILHQHGRLDISDSIIDGNTSTAGGGGICTFDDTEIRRTTISRNRSRDLSLHGGGGGGIQARLATDAGATLAMSDSIVRDNVVQDGSGGGISLHGIGELHNVRIERNRTVASSTSPRVQANGGGIAVGADERGSALPAERSRALRASNLTVADNQSQGVGAGMFLGPLGAYRLTEITGATISNNRSARAGGGVYVLSHDVALTNVTISGNSTIPSVGAATSNSGAGLHLAYSVARLVHTTIAFNETHGAIGAGLFAWNSKVAMRGNLFFQNRGLDGCFADLSEFTSYLGNLADGDGCPSDQPVGLVAWRAGLDPVLRDNGGPTKTHALLEGSIAIDAAVGGCLDANGGTLAVDQRGVSRPMGAECDAGAYERFRLNLVLWQQLLGVFRQSMLFMLDDARLILAEMKQENDREVSTAEDLLRELELASHKVAALGTRSAPPPAIDLADIAVHLSRVEQVRLSFSEQSRGRRAVYWKTLGQLGARAAEQLDQLKTTDGQ